LWQVTKKVVNNSEVVEPVTPQWKIINRDDDVDQPMVSFEFDGLKERASYEVKVRMRNSRGWSEYNQPFVFTTSHGRRGLVSLELFLRVVRSVPCEMTSDLDIRHDAST